MPFYTNGLTFENNEGPDSIVDGLTFRALHSSAIDCFQSSPTIRNCIFKDGKGHPFGGGGGVTCIMGSPLIKNCLFYNNLGGMEGGSPIAIWNYNDPNQIIIQNCVIKGNTAYCGGGIVCCDANALLENCTIASNNSIGNCNFPDGGGITVENSNVEIKNSIIWGNKADDANEIAIFDYVHSGYTPSTVSISYCDIKGGLSEVYVDPCSTLNWGDGNIDIDPCFAIEPNDGGDGWIDNYQTPENESVNNELGDVHLKSQTGRWKFSIYIGLDTTGDGFINFSDFAAFANSWQTTGGDIPADLDRSGLVDFSDLNLLLDNYLNDYLTGQWVTDDVTSLCIDAGDPNSDWTEELWPHGKQINMGAYGGTSQASMSTSPVGHPADFNNDDFVDAEDLGLFADMWLSDQMPLAEDINRDGSVNFPDWAEFANHWLWVE